ncbi:uncharacterized protein [Eurosta solidaginis]|uniref:uncharacterized protein isoform X2 n=1 Tax=Eurosta solidaginis TaxID=178769 RepID=UPI003530B44D
MDDDILDSHCVPSAPRAVTFEQITTADLLLADGVTITPCTNAENCQVYNMDLYFKKEFMQPTGSFKERGARLALLLLSSKQKEIGVISASTGNHAVAISYHGNQLNIPITVVVPTCTLVSNIKKCHSYNAKVVVEGRDICESRVVALVLAKENDLEYINGYDHPDVIAGCGTIGFEILKQIPKFSAVVVPIGGGGLIAGLATTIKTVSPKTKVIGVEVEKCASFSRALAKGSSIYTPPNSSLADSLLVPIVGCNALAMSSAVIDKIVVVSEVWVALAMLRLAEEEGCIVEGAGAVGFAAILSGQLKELEMKRVVVLLTGCNISVPAFGRALERGLAAERRFMQNECDCSKHERRVHTLVEKLAPHGLSTEELLSECVWMKTTYKWEAVLGAIDPNLLGRTLTHEHISLDFEKFYCEPPEEFKTYLKQKITLETAGFVRQYPYSSHENIHFHDEEAHEAVKKDLFLYKKWGGGSIVENSSHGLNRNLELMVDFEKSTGVHIIAGTGHYVHNLQTEDHLNMSIEQLTDLYSKEIITGVELEGVGTVKCGYIGEVGSVYPLHDFEKHAIRATGEIQEVLGCGVSFHPGRDAAAPFEIMRLYLEAGGRADKAIMSHIDRTLIDIDDVLEFAKLGSYIQYDLFGIETSFYQFNTSVDMPSDGQRISHVLKLLEEGLVNRILLSHDIHTKHRLTSYGGHGYHHLHMNVLPRIFAKADVSIIIIH